MNEDDIIFDDVYELCEVISKYVFAFLSLFIFLIKIFHILFKCYCS